MNQIWVLVGFHVFVIAMLAIDLGIFQRKAHTVSMKEAAGWTTVWISLAMLFALGIWWFKGKVAGVEFVTGYLIELSLSVDNLFVFLVIFRYFCVPQHLRHRVLFWGILGALIMRASFIILGGALLDLAHWMIYVFGLFLIFTGLKLLRAGHEEVDPGRNIVLRIARKLFPVVNTYDSSHFFVRLNGKLFATPMFLVLLVIESTDVVFAIDSIPAIFGVTQDKFIVYTSNIFAILGLRALYFLTAGFLGMFRYLNVGLALVLTFVGVKMLLEQPLQPWLQGQGIGKEQIIFFSLTVIATILSCSVIASLLASKEAGAKTPEEILDEALPNGAAPTCPPNLNSETKQEETKTPPTVSS